MGDWNRYYSNGYSINGGLKLSIPADIVYFHLGFKYSKRSQDALVEPENDEVLTPLKTYGIMGGAILNIPVSSIVIPFIKFDVGTFKTSSQNIHIEEDWSSEFGLGVGFEVFPGTKKFSLSLSSNFNLTSCKIKLSKLSETGPLYGLDFSGKLNYYLY